MPTITLITDFGLADWFVGTMKGVIAGLAPGARVIDLTHGIPAGDVRAGAFALLAGYRFFPKGTVHVVVVDPGVGSQRSAIAVQTRDYVFVGPDNGVLSWALGREKIRTIRWLQNRRYFLEPVSRTFHGRDVFAPVAAHLSKGVDIRKLGPPLDALVQIPWPEPVQSGGETRGEVIYIDRFGNAITNMAAGLLPDVLRPGLSVFVRGKRVCGLHEFYQAVPAGRPVAVAGSSGLIEIAINGGSAAKQLGLKVGAPVLLRRSTS